MNTIKKILVLLFSSGLGLVAGGIVVTLVIAIMNYLAQDGPIFPAPLVAFVVVAPVSIILFVIQCIVVAYELIGKQRLGSALLWVGLAGGLVAGLSLYFVVIAPYQSRFDYWPLLALGGLGTFQGLIVFGCHWAADKLRIAT
jgi:hypothetical protein